MSGSFNAAQTATMRTLRDAGIETPALDARVLLMSATGLSVEALIARSKDLLPPEDEMRLADFVSRRLSGEPVSRIRGVREFYGRDFAIDGHTLDPRADTETLIDAALQILARRDREQEPLRILDLGTGSGCILITLLAEYPHTEGIGVDISQDALRMARKNAQRLGVAGRARFFAASWFEGLKGRFDLIVSNPPYITQKEIQTLPREVAAHDPMMALDGGTDGLEAYRSIAAKAAKFLRPRGHLLVEIGAAQADAVADLLHEGGFVIARNGITADLGGRARCIHAEVSEGRDMRHGE